MLQSEVLANLTALLGTAPADLMQRPDLLELGQLIRLVELAGGTMPTQADINNELVTLLGTAPADLMQRPDLLRVGLMARLGSVMGGGSATAPHPIGEMVWYSLPVTTNPFAWNGWLYVVPDGSRVGPDGAAGADIADDRFQQLYLLWWLHYNIVGGRGASAATDWAAGKLLQLPDPGGRVLVAANPDTSNGLEVYPVGGTGGIEQVTLTEAEIPPHSHSIPNSGAITHAGPYSLRGTSPFAGQATSTNVAGGGLPHENRPPYFVASQVVSMGVQA